MEAYEYVVLSPLLLVIPLFVIWLLLRGRFRESVELRRAHRVLTLIVIADVGTKYVFHRAIGGVLSTGDVPITQTVVAAVYMATSVLLLVLAKPLARAEGKRTQRDDDQLVRVAAIGVRLLAVPYTVAALLLLLGIRSAVAAAGL